MEENKHICCPYCDGQEVVIEIVDGTLSVNIGDIAEEYLSVTCEDCQQESFIKITMEVMDVEYLSDRQFQNTCN